jgi:hypothetical protein
MEPKVVLPKPIVMICHGIYITWFILSCVKYSYLHKIYFKIINISYHDV